MAHLADAGKSTGIVSVSHSIRYNSEFFVDNRRFVGEITLYKCIVVKIIGIRIKLTTAQHTAYFCD